MIQLYRYFYNKLPIRKTFADTNLVILTDEEIAAIKRKERFAIWAAAFFGAMGVILLYIPYYLFPYLFPNTPISLLGFDFEVPFIFLGYSVFMVAIEILLLTLLHIWVTHEVAALSGYINPDTKNEEDKRKLLINISLDKKGKDLLEYGIDPYQGLNKSALIAWNLMITLKATLSNMLFKFIIQKMLGRYAVKALQDFAGIPIFAAWNAFGTKKILKQSRVIIMGQNVVSNLAPRIKQFQPTSEDFNFLLYQTLRYIAISKRDFHQNHYLLTKYLFELYDIKPNHELCKKKEYLQKLSEADDNQQNICKMLITLGFILDGQLSAREQLRIVEMRNDGIFDFTIHEMKEFNHQFVNGKGVEQIITKYLHYNNQNVAIKDTSLTN